MENTNAEKKLKIGVQLYSVRDEMEKDFEGTIQKMKDLGYDGIELAGLFDKTPEQVREICDRIGIEPISAHVPYYDLPENPEKVLNDYLTIGCKYVAIPYLNEECRPGTDGWEDTITGIRKIAESAKKLGIQLLYHNHNFEFVETDGKYALDVLYETIPSDLLQTEIDTCWINCAGEQSVEYIAKYADRSPIVHLKDYILNGTVGKTEKLYELIGLDDDGQQENARDYEFRFRPVGYGQQDFPAIIEACKKANTEWVVVEQDLPSDGETSLESVKMSIDYLKSLGL